MAKVNLWEVEDRWELSSTSGGATLQENTTLRSNQAIRAWTGKLSVNSIVQGHCICAIYTAPEEAAYQLRMQYVSATANERMDFLCQFATDHFGPKTHVSFLAYRGIIYPKDTSPCNQKLVGMSVANQDVRGWNAECKITAGHCSVPLTTWTCYVHQRNFCVVFASLLCSAGITNENYCW